MSGAGGRRGVMGPDVESGKTVRKSDEDITAQSWTVSPQSELQLRADGLGEC